MTATILKRKTSIYLLFVILTLGFAYASFYLFEEDLVVRTIPQVKRAMVQVSRLLPQLEENEEAVREVYDDLEEKRRQFIENNEEDLGEQRIGTKSAEKIIDQTLSWMNRVTKLRVGRQGHVVVVSQNDYTILAHPNESYIGQPMYTVNDIDLDKVIDISEIGSKEISDDFHLFFPASFFERRISLENIEETADAGIYGAVFTYKDTYILCGTTLMEILVYVILRSFFTTLFFFSITWVFVRYIGFLLLWMKDSRREFRSKLVCYGALGITVLFVTTWYYQTMMDMTGDIATMNDHAKVAVETLNTYRKYRDSLSAWLDKQYLEQCYLAADMVKARGKDDLSRQDIAGIAQELGVEYIYVFDKTGKTIVTNSPFDSFELSNNKADQSYAFRPLLGGRPYVIQEPQEDEASGEMMQYIGVSLRDEDDLADGFVQIAVNPGLRNRLLSPIHVQTVLDNLVIGLPDYALAVDKETMKIVATTGLGYKKASIEDIGIDVNYMKKDFNGIFVIEGYTYYAGVSESEDLFLMPLVRSTENKSSLLISFKLALLCAAAFILFIIAALFEYKKVLAAKEHEDADASNARLFAKREAVDLKETGQERDEDEEQGLFHSLINLFKADEKDDFDSRWGRDGAVPGKEQTPEMRAGRIVYRMLLVFSAALILYETTLINFGMDKENLTGFSYVILGKWQRGVNLFSFSYCLFLLCVLYVFQELLNQILYHIARISDLKRETILLLLRNALKYSCALVFLYIGLAKFGIDTKTLWASAGVLSLMVGFGAKDLVNDIIAGLFLIFEGTYKIGDWVTIGTWYGVVEEIGFRYTKVRYYHETKIFNNSSIRDFINNDDDIAKELVYAPIPYETDILEIEKLLKREIPTMAAHIPQLVGLPKYQGVSSFDESCIMLRFAIYSKPSVRHSVKRAMQREIKLLFDREHISIPYKHVVVQDYKDEANTYVFAKEAGESGEESQGTKR